MKTIQIGKTLIGPGHPTYIVAEMSGNHGGQLEEAKAVIRAAKETGADAIKIQTYTPDTITLNSDKPDFCIPSSNPWSKHSTLYQLYQKAFTPFEWHAELFAEAKMVGIEIFSAPFDHSAVDLLEELGAQAYKIASPEITDIPLLERVAATKKPVILSTGVAELEDLELAVSTLRQAGCTQLAILRCSSIYPSPPEVIHLRTIPDMIERFDCPAGLSDHTLGIGVPIAAVALGARIIEKHFLRSKDTGSVDAFFSLDVPEFKQMVREIRIAEKSLGEVCYTLTEEGKKNAWGRRSLYISKDIHTGEVLTAEHVRSVRPAFGLHPKHYKEVIGKKATRDLTYGDRLSKADVDWGS